MSAAFGQRYAVLTTSTIWRVPLARDNAPTCSRLMLRGRASSLLPPGTQAWNGSFSSVTLVQTVHQHFPFKNPKALLKSIFVAAAFRIRSFDLRSYLGPKIHSRTAWRTCCGHLHSFCRSPVMAERCSSLFGWKTSLPV